MSSHPSPSRPVLHPSRAEDRLRMPSDLSLLCFLDGPWYVPPAPHKHRHRHPSCTDQNGGHVPPETRALVPLRTEKKGRYSDVGRRGKQDEGNEDRRAEHEGRKRVEKKGKKAKHACSGTGVVGSPSQPDENRQRGVFASDRN
eukprot:scaffold995_cov358-Pavlova_lutheri.AAC.14